MIRNQRGRTMNKTVHKVHVSTTEAGKFLVTSDRSPFFCFEADTEQEALDITVRALEFYHSEGERTPIKPLPSKEFIPLTITGIKDIEIAVPAA